MSTDLTKMSPVTFYSGSPRKICVNRTAIMHNLKHNTDYPTLMVINYEGTMHEFHAIKCENATVTFIFDANSDIKVCGVTNDKIVGYTSKDAAYKSFLNTNFSEHVSLRKRIWNQVSWFADKTLRGLGYVPIVACMIPERFILPPQKTSC